MSLKTLRSKKRKFLRFMREAVQRRLTVNRPELSTPLPLPFLTEARSSLRQRSVTVNRDIPRAWSLGKTADFLAGEKRISRARLEPWHRVYPRNLNWSAR